MWYKCTTGKGAWSAEGHASRRVILRRVTSFQMCCGRIDLLIIRQYYYNIKIRRSAACGENKRAPQNRCRVTLTSYAAQRCMVKSNTSDMKKTVATILLEIRHKFKPE